MRYFLLRFILAVLFSLGLLILFLYTVRRVKKIKVKHRFSYFLPPFLALVSAGFIAKQSGPMALDCLEIYRNQYQVKQVEAETIKLFHRCLMSDGDTYFYNGFAIRPQAGTTYQITYAKWSRFIVDIRAI